MRERLSLPFFYVALLAACGPEGRIPPSEEPAALRLDGQPWAAPAELAVLDSLRAGGVLQVTERDADRVTGLRIGGERGYWMLRLPEQAPAGRRGRLRLRYQGSVEGSLRLGALVRGEDAPRRLAQAHRVRAGAWEDLAFDLDGPSTVRLSPIAWTLHPPDDEIESTVIRDLTWTPGSEIAAVSHEVDGVVRRAHSLEAGRALEWPLPERFTGVIELAVAPHGVSAPRVSFDLFVSVGCGKGRHALWARRIGGQERAWHELRLPMPDCDSPRHLLRVEREDGEDPRRFALVTPPRAVDAKDRRPNILLIVVDTLRGDGLSGFGNPRPTSPELDSFLAECVRFTNAYATASWTHPSTGSILSGLLPHEHGLGLASSGMTHFRGGVNLLAERLRDAGYATAATSNNLIVSSTEGFARGYDRFDERPLIAPEFHGAKRVSESAWEWLEGRASPFHAYLHYFDPHDRYQAPPPWTERFVPESSSELPSELRDGRLHGLLDRMYDRGTPTGAVPSAEEIALLRGLYDGEIGYADRWISWLLGRLRSSGQLENTIVILCSDHGEEFLEHGRLKHGHALFDELVRVPLAIRFPKVAPAVVETPVSVIDIVPTALAACGLADPTLPGRDLATAQTPRPVFALAPAGLGVRDTPAHGTLQMVRDGRWKLIRQLDPPRVELFDLADDPFERVDRAREIDPAPWIAMLEETFARMREVGFDASDLDPAALEKLRALGYAH